MEINKVTEQIIGAAVEVHRSVGPGLLESAYEECMSHELHLRAVPIQRQLPLPIEYKGVKLDCGYRLDFLVAQAINFNVPVLKSGIKRIVNNFRDGSAHSASLR